MSARQKDLLRHIEYPESDGKPMAETDTHRQLMTTLIETLQIHFAAESEVYVSGNLLLYYVEGDKNQSVAPDVFVVRGVANHERRTYQMWEEGQAPQVVFEISSRSTKNEDLQEKKNIYALIGVREYFIFDPEYKLKPALRAFRLHRQELVEQVVTHNRVQSEELGLELVNTGKTLRLFNPQTNELLRTLPEEAAARQQAEFRAAQEAAHAARLAAKLRELGLDPDQI